jgi:protein gp37
VASSNSPIEWTDKTWNPTRGCRRISPGCQHCYAERVAYRFSGAGKPYEGLVRLGKGGPVWTGKGVLVPDALDEPLGWRKAQMVFVNSMSDLFYEEFTEEQIDMVWATMVLSPWHTYQVLTKRPERAARYLNDPGLYQRLLRQVDQVRRDRPWRHGPDGARLDEIGVSDPARTPARNIWLLTSTENQASADERIPHLLRCPAAVRGVSYEPALGPVDFGRFLEDWGSASSQARPGMSHGRVGWIIAGGESGPGARDCDLAWLRGAVAQGKAAGVPVFVKQLGARPGICWRRSAGPVPAAAIDAHLCAGGSEPEDEWDPLTLNNPKGGDMAEWPADLQVREFPQVGVSRG